MDRTDQSQSFLSEHARRFLERVGVDEAFMQAAAASATPAVPELRSDHPRLTELRRLYRERRCWPDAWSVWSREQVSSDVPFQRFRADCAYLWQHRDFNTPAALVLTYLYLEALGLGADLRRLGEDGAFGCFTQPIRGALASRDLLDSVCEIAFLRRMIGAERLHQGTLLDIGAGYGRLAHRLVQAGQKGCVLCADAVPESAFLCEFYLRFRGCGAAAKMIPLPDLRLAVAPHKVLMAMNIHSFSECPLTAIAWWMRLLSELEIQYLFVVPNSDANGGRGLLSTEHGGVRNDFSLLIRASGYRRVAIEPKYADAEVQRFGVSPTYHHFFERVR